MHHAPLCMVATVHMCMVAPCLHHAPPDCGCVQFQLGQAEEQLGLRRFDTHPHMVELGMPYVGSALQLGVDCDTMAIAWQPLC